MTLTEFKAWFDGYTENLEGAPNGKQWKRIKEQVGKIDGVDCYVRRYPYWQYTSQTQSTCANIYNAAQAQAANNLFNGESAMYAAGKMEAGNA